VLRYCIQLSLLPFLSGLLLKDGRSSIPSSTSIRSAAISFHTLHLPHLSTLLTLDWLLYYIGAPQSPLALLGLDLHPSISFCTPLLPSPLPLPTSHTTSGAPPFLVALLFFPSNSSYCLSISIVIHCNSTSIPNLLDITNRAKRHWNSISPTCQAGIIRKYKERLQLLCAVIELCVSAFVGPVEMGDWVDDIESMFYWYHSDRLVGLLFRFYLLSFLNYMQFSLISP